LLNLLVEFIERACHSCCIKSVSRRVLKLIEGKNMATITKKELIDRIADNSGGRRVQVKRVVQQFLDEIVNELGKGNRLEFRDFGVFETKIRKARKAQNPKTLEPVAVPEKRTVKFKVGRLMKQKLGDLTGASVDDEAGDIDEMNEAGAEEEEDSDSEHTVPKAHHGHSAN
jgi:integration host factor subunit beta